MIPHLKSSRQKIVRELSLFSGYGGFSLGLKLAGITTRTVGYVEIDRYCQQLIQARIRDGFLDDAPIWPDIRSFDGEQCRGVVDIITAGFPCQPHSVAGQRRGEADERNLWPDTIRVVREVEPRFVLLENVPGILIYPGYAGTVVGQLAEAGYDCIWRSIPATTVGAPHLRWRWWCLAYPNTTSRGWVGGESSFNRNGTRNNARRGFGRLRENVAYTEGQRRPLWPTQTQRQRGFTSSSKDVADSSVSRQHSPDINQAGSPSRSCWWEVEPPLGRVVDGYPDRVGELKALGNGIVPAVVREFLRS